MTTTAIAKPDEKPQTLADVLEARKGNMADILPRHLTPERVIRVALTCVSQTPKLLECTTRSVVEAVMQACALGLEPGGPMHDSYLVPFKEYNKETRTSKMICRLIPGYRGLITLALQSGKIHSIESRVVYDKDLFKYKFGLVPLLRHEPEMDAEDPGPLRFVYAIARFAKGGPPLFEVMSRKQVEKVRATSKSADSGPWSGWFDEMARKTVIKRLSKYLPMSAELADAIDLDRADVIDADYTEKPQGALAPAGGGNAGLRSRLAAGRPQAALRASPHVEVPAEVEHQETENPEPETVAAEVVSKPGKPAQQAAPAPPAKPEAKRRVDPKAPPSHHSEPPDEDWRNEREVGADDGPPEWIPGSSDRGGK